jgi:hypothetical protein
MKQHGHYLSSWGCKHPANMLFAIGNGEKGCKACMSVGRDVHGNRLRYQSPHVEAVAASEPPATEEVTVTIVNESTGVEYTIEPDPFGEVGKAVAP